MEQKNSINLETYGIRCDPQRQKLIKEQLKILFSSTSIYLKKNFNTFKEQGYDSDLMNKILVTFEKWDASSKFPGAQPISFQSDHFYEIQSNEYVVCEKSDGLRYFLIQLTTNELFIVDRQYNIRQVYEVTDQRVFQQPDQIIKINNLFDGELILDRFQEDLPIFLVFDALVINQTPIMLRSFKERLLAAHNEVRNRFRLHRDYEVQPQMKDGLIDIYMKDMFKIKDSKYIFENIIPKLEHGNDGLILTMNKCFYYPGTCPQILKWKPSHQNTIDFQIKLIKQTSPTHYLWGLYVGREGNLRLFDCIFLKDQQSNEAMVRRIQQAPNHIVIIECNFDRNYQHPHAVVYNYLKNKLDIQDDRKNIEFVVKEFNFNQQIDSPDNYFGGWQYYKHRTERTEPNAFKSALSVWMSIVNGVEQEDLINICNDIDFPENNQNSNRRARSDSVDSDNNDGAPNRRAKYN